MRLMRFRLLVLMIAANFAVAGLVTGEAHACSCAGIPSPEEGLRNSDAVFWGEVVDIGSLNVKDQEATTASGPFLDPVTFNVKESWKGVSEESATVYGQGDEVSCGLNFEKGESYLIYAGRPDGQEDRALETNLCSATTPFSDTESAVRALGPPDDDLPDTGGPGLQTALATLAVLVFAVLFVAAIRRPERRGS